MTQKRGFLPALKKEKGRDSNIAAFFQHGIKYRERVVCGFYHPNRERRIPAATAEPMTPATFGPIAYMSR